MIIEWAKPTANELQNAVIAPTLENASGLYNN